MTPLRSAELLRHQGALSSTEGFTEFLQALPSSTELLRILPSSISYVQVYRAMKIPLSPASSDELHQLPLIFAVISKRRWLFRVLPISDGSTNFKLITVEVNWAPKPPINNTELNLTSSNSDGSTNLRWLHQNLLDAWANLNLTRKIHKHEFIFPNPISPPIRCLS